MKITFPGVLALALIPAAVLAAAAPGPDGDLDALMGNLLAVSDGLYALADAAPRSEDAAQLEIADEHIRKADAALARKDLPRYRKEALLSFARFATREKGSKGAKRREDIYRKAAILKAQYSLLNLRTAEKPSEKEAEWEALLAKLKTPPAPKREIRKRDFGVAAPR